ncbi:MAG: DUF1653 domain-containing protein [Lachnospiraceae bacterium]|nr:DUF1653 domain-containing protein [Lachnospiraceae bacterium]
MAQKRNTPIEGQIYKHFKGSLYKIVTIAVHTETSDKLVVYQSVEKPERVFARPLDMFMSEVDRLRYPLVKAKYRFTLLVEEPEEEQKNVEEVVSEEESEDVEKPEKAEQEIVESKDSLEDVNVEGSDDTAVYKEDGELVLDPYVEAVLDEKDFSKKIESFEMLRGKCTEEMLTTIAISLDIQLMGDSVEEKYAQILKTLRMHEKYESARLRN